MVVRYLFNESIVEADEDSQEESSFEPSSGDYAGGDDPTPI
jgi:hypothetical protein